MTPHCVIKQRGHEFWRCGPLYAEILQHSNRWWKYRAWRIGVRVSIERGSARTLTDARALALHAMGGVASKTCLMGNDGISMRRTE